ncbi:MAG: alpha/beta fold hydrolase [Myxococcota bacterium]
MQVESGATEHASRSPGLPALPRGQRLHLPGRGTTFLREMAGPPGAPTVVLLHGWVASGGLNWLQAFAPLSRHFRVLAPDLRGHARGLRSWRRFGLSDCADDVANLLGELELPRVIVVGYSMGGAVAQLLWRRHRSQVAGLVLCATGPVLVPALGSRTVFRVWMSGLANAGRLGDLAAFLPRQALRALAAPAAPRQPGTLRSWAMREMARHDWRMLLEAGEAVSRYDARRWIGKIDVPTAVVATLRDRALGLGSQLRMARAIRGARVHPVHGGHAACAHPSFAAPLVEACRDVARRCAQAA